MIKNSIDFVIPQFTMRIPFLRRHIELLVRSIHKYVKGIDYKIYMEHRITPVIKGTRYSIITWMEGDTFR